MDYHAFPFFLCIYHDIAFFELRKSLLASRFEGFRATLSYSMIAICLQGLITRAGNLRQMSDCCVGSFTSAFCTVRTFERLQKRLEKEIETQISGPIS